MASPTFGTKRGESGQLSQRVRPTRRGPAPTAKRISVVVGFSETMRFGVESKVTVLPKSSLKNAVESTTVFALDLPTDPSHERESARRAHRARDESNRARDESDPARD